jgi:hypothetical protein
LRSLTISFAIALGPERIAKLYRESKGIQFSMPRHPEQPGDPLQNPMTTSDKSHLRRTNPSSPGNKR